MVRELEQREKRLPLYMERQSQLSQTLQAAQGVFAPHKDTLKTKMMSQSSFRRCSS